ncbi:surface layer protein [Coprothermobacteraceae bacterium]|nr:surface layer protein [Coprothermobacteraceae bacterium]
MRKILSLVLALVIVGLSGLAFPAEAEVGTVSMRVDAMHTATNEVALQVYVVNSGAPVTLTFNSGYWYDVEVRGPSLYYKDSQGKAYIQMIIDKRFPTGNTHVATLKFSSLKEGTYSFRAWLVNQNVSVEGAFSVGKVPEPTDIAGSWARQYIWDALQKRLLSASSQAFRPSEPISRGQFLVALAKALNVQPVTLESLGQNPFKDVDVNNGASGYFWALYNRSVATGYPDGTLRPYNFLTRAETAKLLAVAVSGTTTFEESASDMRQPPFYWVFTDTNGHWAERYISYVWRNALMLGYPDRTFKPNDYLTKEQAAVILDRLSNAVVNK